MLGVAGIAQGYLGAKRPAGELQRKGQRWSHVKPPDKRGCMESRLTAIESFECSAVGPVKGRASELAVYRRDFNARSRIVFALSGLYCDRWPHTPIRRARGL